MANEMIQIKGRKEMTKKKSSTKAYSIAASLLMTFSLVAPSLASAETVNKLHQSAKNSSVAAEKKVSDRLLTSFKDEEKVTFLVKFKEKADTEKVAASAKENAEKASLSSQKS